MPIRRDPRRAVALLLLALPFIVASSRPAQILHEITITATDYAFALPSNIKPGATAIAFDNQGQHRHEMSLVRLKAGITVDSALRATRGPDRRSLMDVNTGGILFADPGQRTEDRLLVTLTAGRTYLVTCTLRDAPDQPQHLALGMVTGFTVR